MKSLKFFSGSFFIILVMTACTTQAPQTNSQTLSSQPTQIMTIDLNSFLNQQTSLTGTAKDAKGGAVLLVNNQPPIYIENLDSWPDNLFGKKVEVTGRLTLKQYLLAATGDVKSGTISQGTAGEQTDYVFEKAAWKLK